MNLPFFLNFFGSSHLIDREAVYFAVNSSSCPARLRNASLKNQTEAVWMPHGKNLTMSVR
jgi:hypothetical protein